MGQIVGGAAKPKRCNLNKLSQLGTPAAGEHIPVSSDNSMNAAGQGNFDCYIVGDGTTDATALKLKSVETLIGIFDISEYHATGDVLAKYADLSAALDGGNNIPQSLRKGGMSVKFVQSSDNKYVQYMLTKDEWSINVKDWQKMNLEEEVSQLEYKIGDIKKDGSIYEINAIIPVTQGTAIGSRVNIASGISIPAGTTIKVKLSGTTGIISEVHIVDNSWRILYKGIYTDGTELVIKTSYETTSLGLNLTSDTAIGTGDVVVMVSYSYESSLGYKVDEVTEEMNIINTR